MTTEEEWKFDKAGHSFLVRDAHNPSATVIVDYVLWLCSVDYVLIMFLTSVLRVEIY